MPDLGHMQDVADFVTRSGCGSGREGGLDEGEYVG